MPAPEDIFPKEFVPNIEGASYHPKWVAANKNGDAPKWAAFRDALLTYKAGDTLAVPTMATKYGKALVAAGKEHMSVTDLGSVYPGPTPPPPPPDPGATPPAIANQGYTMVFFDDFDTLDLTKWIRAGWQGYQTTPVQDASVANSILSISSRRADGYPNRNISSRLGPALAPRTGGNVWQNGYFECHSKYPYGKGSWPAFWLFSDHWVSTGTVPPYVAEIDIMEAGPGLDGLYLNAYNHVVHKNTGGAGGVADTFAPTGAAQFASPNLGNLTLGFHTYACKWTTTTVSFYCDDIFLASCPVYANSTNQDLFMILSMWASHGGWPGSTDGTTPDVLTHQIDWVRVWQQ